MAALEEQEEYLVQYIICRSDLLTVGPETKRSLLTVCLRAKQDLGWPKGSVLAQAAHASVAVIAENLSHENVQHYINPARIDKMHKVVLEAKNEAELLKIGEKLKEGNIPYKLWVEQPENFPTCIATLPHLRNTLKPLLKRLKLFK